MVRLAQFESCGEGAEMGREAEGSFGCCLENRASGRTAGSLCLESRVSGLGLVDGALFPSEQPKLVPVPWDGY